jgi:dipeptidyl aminopeptidase/acylaminoacyl peptidase
VFLIVLACRHAAADVFLNEGTNISADVAPDGRIVIDLLGALWIVPAGGGAANPIASGERTARAPRWSPDGNRLIFEADKDERTCLRVHDLTSGETRAVGSEEFADRQPDWHPDGTRIVYSSARGETGFDIWETDVATGLSWRLTEQPGDERDAAWSANGRDLVYVHEKDGIHSLVLLRRGYEAEILASGEESIRAPSWRPDGSLITWLQHGFAGWQVNMTILSEPRLTRMLMRNEDFFLAPVAWLDREQLVYTADGLVRLRRFDSWSSRTLPFRANVGAASGFESGDGRIRDLPATTEPDGRHIVRADRLYDGIGAEYTRDRDIVIEGGTIAAVEPRGARDDGILIDLGDVTVLPGYIDGFAALPHPAEPATGPLLLAFGVTTVIADTPDATELDSLWSGDSVPGPRVLRAQPIVEASDEAPYPWLLTVGGDMTEAAAAQPAVREWQKRGVAVLADSWQAGLGSGAAMLLGTNTRPTSPAGFHYQDVQLASGIGTITFVSGLADAGTPGLDEIHRTRAASLMAPHAELSRRLVDLPDLRAAAPLLVLGSRPNGMPPGIAVHAEFRALAGSGLRPDQVLRCAGVNTAAALGAGFRLGRISTGAVADLVIVRGDPLGNIADALNVVGVIRNGRFFSLSGLLDKATSARIVE